VSRRALVCELDRKALLAFLTSAPAASLRWMRSIALRLDDDRRHLLAVLTSDLTAQVAFLLLEHAEPGPNGRPVVRLSHEVIAQLLGARRQSVSRVIADLRERGVLSTAYRQIVLDDPDALQDVAGPSLPT
jgi:CRP-like cAMP-binding protein